MHQDTRLRKEPRAFIPTILAGGSRQGYTFGMRDGLIIFALCIVAIIIGGWLFFYAPQSLAVFPRARIEQAAYAPSAPAQAAAVEVAVP